MKFIDDEAMGSAESDADDVLVPSSQTEDDNRPRKRRRLSVTSSNNSDGFDDASSRPRNHSSPPEVDEDQEYRSKYEEVMHVPQHAATQKDTFVTQLTQPWSSPTHIRGPRWRRQQTPDSPEPRRAVAPAQVEEVVLERIPSTPPRPREQPPAFIPIVEDDFGDDDPDLLDAFMTAELPQQFSGEINIEPQPRPDRAGQPIQNMRQTTLFGTQAVQPGTLAQNSSRAHNWPLANRVEKPSHHKLNLDAMKTWVYPTNLGTIRDYQYTIVHAGLFHNLLVALPTGLGKTFIAATIMLNWYRWTENTQIIFVAPTKPLVSQQVDACLNIAGIPRSQTTLLTGETQPPIRAAEWQEKRVFFMTPQTLINDLKSGIADPKKIVLLVVDEAHRATGGYAYTEVVKFVQQFNESFRVLALTATPGSSVESVQQVISGLNIARIEIRTEDSIDIRQYVHAREETLELFEFSLEIQETLDLIRTAIKPLQDILLRNRATWQKDPCDNTLYGLMMSQKEWAKSQAGQNAQQSVKWQLVSVFKVMMTLANSVDLLKYHGIGPFYHKMKIFEDESYGAGKYAKQVVESQAFKDMMNRLRAWVNNADFVGHPKLEYLKGVALNHFMDAGEGLGAAGGRPPSETRIMVFAHFRDSAEEIVRTLKKHEPMVRPHIFVGQASTKGSEGMDQKKQQAIIKDFKNGLFNVLVATSIGEEGLDIGEVDLIVCYDASASPIRMLQRMGRTGRKRAGNVHVLLMKGKEEANFAKAKDNYRKMQDLIESGARFTFAEEKSSRIVPKEIQPVVDKRVVEIPVENKQDVCIEPKKRTAKNLKKPPKRFNMPDDVETGFKFLGGGKTATKRKRTAPSKLDDTEAALPPLDEVLLVADQEAERQAKYGEVSGTQTQFTQIPRLDVHPTVLAALHETGKIRHSTTTKALAATIQRMRQRAEDCIPPTEYQVQQALQALPSLQGRRTASKPASRARAPRTKARAPRPAKRAPSRTPSPPAEENDYADLGSFIDDDPLNGDLDGDLNGSTDATSPDTLLVTFDKAPKEPGLSVDEPFWVSQPVRDTADLDEELPSMEDIFDMPTVRPVAASSNVMSGAKSSKTHTGAARPRAMKRVIDSDDDE